jgi:hypothetical protein
VIYKDTLSEEMLQFKFDDVLVLDVKTREFKLNFIFHKWYEFTPEQIKTRRVKDEQIGDDKKTIALRLQFYGIIKDFTKKEVSR